jgi:hypothetical protein
MIEYLFVNIYFYLYGMVGELLSSLGKEAKILLKSIDFLSFFLIFGSEMDVLKFYL